MRNAILEILTNGTGCGVECLGSLFLYELEDGRFAVTDVRDNEWLFEKAEEAVDFFLKEREKEELGFDFERRARGAVG